MAQLRKFRLLLLILVVATLAFVACSPQAPAPDTETVVQTVEVTRIVEGEVVTEVATIEVEVTRVVEVPVEVTPVPEEAPDVAEEERYGGTLMVGYSQDLTSLDPPKAWSTMDWGTAAQLLYNRLYTFDADDNLVPDLAADMPEISEDGTVYTVSLKEGVLFHNGRELVAEDVKYSLERNAKPDSGTWNATAPLSNVVGGQAVIDGEAETAEGIRVVDDYTIEFTLVEADAYFVHGLTLITNSIVPQEVVEEFGEDFSFNPVGTGPFQFVEWLPGERLEFARYEDYFEEGKPYLDGIVYEVGADPSVYLLRFEQGEIDVVADGLPAAEIARIASDPEMGELFLNTKTFLTGFLAFNTETPPFDNPDVRKALAMAINRERLIDLSANAASITYDWYPPSHYNCTAGDENPLYTYDPEAAQQLLADAGYPDGFQVESWFRVIRPWLNRIPEAVQQDLAAVGVEVELLQLETAVASEMVDNHELPMFMQAWGSSFPDPFNFATEIFQTGSVYAERLNYSNPEVDALVEAARQNTDPESRCEQWLQAQELVMQDLPAIPLLVAGYPDVRSPRIEDFCYNHTYHRPCYADIWIAPDNR